MLHINKHEYELIGIKRLNKSIFNKDNTHYKDGKYPLFCGQPMALIDTINSPYPELMAFYEKQMAQGWKWDEVSLTQDRQDMLTAPKEIVDLMVDTIMYQWSIDSVAANSILPLFAPFISSPELSLFFTEITRMECLTGDHEVLTTEGWKFISEVTTEDKVAQWDQVTGGISFVKPLDTIKRKHKGKMVHFTNDSGFVDQLVTPNHRMPIVYPYSYKAESVKLAKDVTYHGSNALPVSGVVKSGRGMTDLERLYVAVQADGSLSEDGYTGKLSGKKHYKFHFRKERKSERLLSICERLGLNVVEYKLGSRGGDGVGRTFRVDVPLDMYEERAKTFDWFNIEDITYEWAEDFIQELVYWDGCPAKSGMVRYMSANKSCIDKARIVGILSGYRPKIYTIPAREGVKFPDGICDTKEAYQIGFNKAQHLLGNTIDKREVDYEGYVHCLTVPSSFFMVRRNGAVSITGNCIHGQSYVHIIQQTMDKPKEALYEAMKFKESLERGDKIIKVFDNLAKVGGLVRAGLLAVDSQEAREAVLLGMVNLYILEQISFMSSFAVTFAISELGIFQGIGALVSLIARDEHSTHAAADKYIVKKLKQQMPEEWDKLNEQMIELVDEAVKIELSWNEYLFTNRSCVGLTKTLLDDWVRYMSSDIYWTLGIDVYKMDNPLPYMESYLDLDSVQAAAQETTLVNYQLDSVEDDLGEEELEW